MEPSSPLPWSYPVRDNEDDRRYIADAKGMIVAPCGERDHHQDAEYIVHACNQYPKLVEMLRRLEWFDTAWDTAGGHTECPSCLGVAECIHSYPPAGHPCKLGHEPDCELDALLLELDGETG